MKHGKKYNEQLKTIDKPVYQLDEALAKIKELGIAKFDETIEICFNLGVDPRKSDQQVRGAVSLPSGLGKEVRVGVITSGENIKVAQAAGAEVVGAEDLIEEISKGRTDFDVLLATPDMMPKVGKLGKVLGRKGLMPAPKAGTVVTDISKAVAEQKKGKVEYKADKFGVVHSIIGKKSFTVDQLRDNYKALHDAVAKAKPAAVKGTYMKSIYLAPTMGPSVAVATY